MNNIDVTIIAVYLSFIFGIGIYTRNYIKSFADFMIEHNSKSPDALSGVRTLPKSQKQKPRMPLTF